MCNSYACVLQFFRQCPFHRCTGLVCLLVTEDIILVTVLKTYFCVQAEIALMKNIEAAYSFEKVFAGLQTLTILLRN